jgi:prepilin peptidase CpaA
MQGILLGALAVALVAALFDWRTGHMPNWLTFGALLFAPLAHVAWGTRANGSLNEGLWRGASSLGGLVVCALVPLLLYRYNAIGGGDIKLLAALGAIGGMSLGLEMELYGFIAAAILAPAFLAYDGKLMETLKNSGRLLVNSFLPKARRKPIEQETMSWFRLGPAVFLGVGLTALIHWDEVIRNSP